MYTKFDYVAAGAANNKGSCRDFIIYMAKEDKKDTGHNVEWWFDQYGQQQTSEYIEKLINEDWQGLGKNATKFTTGSISPSEREWLSMGDTEEERLKNFKAWVAGKFTPEFAGNFNKHKLPTEEPWELKGATTKERAANYKKEVATEIISKYAKSFYFNKPTEVEQNNICSSPDPAEWFRAWVYSGFAKKVTGEAWKYDKEKEPDWLAAAGDKKRGRVEALEHAALYAFRERFEAKFSEYKAVLGSPGKDVEQFKEWLKIFSKQLYNDFGLPAKKGEQIIITADNVKIGFKFEHNRYYRGDDKEVQEGRAKEGEVKPGFNKHIHFIVATKTADKQNRINPKTNNKDEFNRVDFAFKIEHSFDKEFDFKRRYEESFAAKLGTKLAAVPAQNKISPTSLGKEAFSDRQAEFGAEHEELSMMEKKGKSL
jgi:hypothetical protein